jgi:hypothetical protein
VQAHDNGVAPQEILAEIEAVRPPTDLPAEGLQKCMASRLCKGLRGKSAWHEKDRAPSTIYMVMAWADTPMPLFRKL